MNYPYVIRKYYSAYSNQAYCFGCFGVPSIVALVIASIFRESLPMTFHTLLFVWGWISWTFIEYIAHRFWMHAHKHESSSKNDFANHHYHHTHPTEIRITTLHRLVLFLVLVVLIWLAYRFDSYFTLVTGFFTGFTLYFFMHVLLHKSWASRFVGKLQEYHIYHHCKYTNRCFGVTVTWWDKIFNTTPPPGAKIPERIRNFYFGHEHHSSSNLKTDS
jgi:sterol desaturase/sphingolipid hydroxylase (fatty acid hydroxylase superfamily)